MAVELVEGEGVVLGVQAEVHGTTKDESTNNPSVSASIFLLQVKVTQN